jgi:hypothetical protein
MKELFATVAKDKALSRRGDDDGCGWDTPAFLVSWYKNYVESLCGPL